MLTPDATVEISLSATGGREAPLPESWFGCILRVNGDAMDVRLWINPAMPLGTTRVVQAAFLDPDRGRRLLRDGTPFELVEGRVIGRGYVRSVLRGQPLADSFNPEDAKRHFEPH